MKRFFVHYVNGQPRAVLYNPSKHRPAKYLYYKDADGSELLLVGDIAVDYHKVLLELFERGKGKVKGALCGAGDARCLNGSDGWCSNGFNFRTPEDNKERIRKLLTEPR